MALRVLPHIFNTIWRLCRTFFERGSGYQIEMEMNEFVSIIFMNKNKSMYFAESKNINTKREKDVGMNQYDWPLFLLVVFKLALQKGRLHSSHSLTCLALKNVIIVELLNFS